MTILITGVTGFVGKPLCALLERGEYAIRRSHQHMNALDWSQDLILVHTVVHLAAREHIMQDKSADPLVKFRAVNENIKFASNDRC